MKNYILVHGLNTNDEVIINLNRVDMIKRSDDNDHAKFIIKNEPELITVESFFDIYLEIFNCDSQKPIEK